MIDQTDATFQEVFSQVGLMEAVKLLPCCISAAVPFQYISRTMTTTGQQGKDVSAIVMPCPTISKPVPAPESHCSPVPYPSSAPTPPGTSSLPLSFLPSIPLVGSPLVGCPFSDFPAIPPTGQVTSLFQWFTWTSSPKKTHVCYPEVEVGVESSFSWGDRNTSELVLESGPRPRSEQGGQDPTSPPSHRQFSRWNCSRSPKSPEDLAYSSSESSQIKVGYSD